MKIAIISSSFLPVVDGVTITVYNRLQQLSKLGHEVILFCPEYSSLKNIYPNWQDYTGKIFPNVIVINLPSQNAIGLNFERDVTSKSYQIVLRELEKFKPDLIHVDEAERLSFTFFKFTGCDFAKKNKIPCVAFFHTNYIDYFDDYFTLPLQLNFIVRKILGFIFVNIYNRYNLTLVASKFTFQKLDLMGIKNLHYDNLLGFNSQEFSASLKNLNFWEKYNLPNLNNKIKLIFVGRLTPDKGWNFGLSALAKMHPKTWKKLAIIIVGDGTIKNDIYQSISQFTSDIYLLGRVENQQIPALLINSDIFVTNSEKETTGLAVLEACAAGIPVIAPNAGGIIDTIKKGENGFLYQSQNQADFLEKLTILIENKSLRESMKLEAKNSVQNFTWENTVNNLVKIFDKITKQNLSKKTNFSPPASKSEGF